MLKEFDPKTITSAGGIVIAAIAVWGIIQLSTGRVDNLVAAMADNTKAVREGNAQISAAILEQARQVQANTAAVQQLLTTRR